MKDETKKGAIPEEKPSQDSNQNPEVESKEEKKKEELVE